MRVVVLKALCARVLARKRRYNRRKLPDKSWSYAEGNTHEWISASGPLCLFVGGYCLPRGTRVAMVWSL